jgi:hypothetical protein
LLLTTGSVDMNNAVHSAGHGETDSATQPVAE